MTGARCVIFIVSVFLGFCDIVKLFQMPKEVNYIFKRTECGEVNKKFIEKVSSTLAGNNYTQKIWYGVPSEFDESERKFLRHSRK